MFPLPEKFLRNTPLRDLVTCEIMETICGILNHLVIEEVDGLSFPYVEKSAQPSRETPWRLRVPKAPAAPAASGATPQAPAASGAAGTSADYARADHVHPAQPGGLGSNVEVAATADAQDTTTWAATNAGKQPLKIWRYRWYYDATDGSEKLVGLKHYEIYNPVTGGLMEVGAESVYTIHEPEEDPNA